MIGTARKPIEEVMGALEAFRKIGVVGCDGCAKACATGGTAQVEEMVKTLTEHGKEVVFDVTPERTCYLNKSRDAFAPLEGRFEQDRGPPRPGLRRGGADRPRADGRVRHDHPDQNGPRIGGPHGHPHIRGAGPGAVQGVRPMHAQRDGRYLPHDQVRQVPPERPLRRVPGRQVRGGPRAGLRLGPHLQQAEGPRASSTGSVCSRLPRTTASPQSRGCSTSRRGWSHEAYRTVQERGIRHYERSRAHEGLHKERRGACLPEGGQIGGEARPRHQRHRQPERRHEAGLSGRLGPPQE